MIEKTTLLKVLPHYTRIKTGLKEQRKFFINAYYIWLFGVLLLTNFNLIAQNTNTWTGANPATSTVGETTVTITATAPGNTDFTATPTGNMGIEDAYTLSTIPGNNSFEFLLTWDIEPDTFSLGDAALPRANDDGGQGTFTITYSTPVTNPIIHIDRLGGSMYNSGYSDNYYSNSSLWTLTTPGLTMTKLSGVSHFELTPTSFQRTPDANQGIEETEVECNSTAAGTACGTIQINGTNITSISFNWSGVGVEGAGADGIEMIFEVPIDSDGDGIKDIDDLDDDNDGITDVKEICPDISTSSTSTITTEIQLDHFGSETTWTLKNSSGITVASGGPYTDAVPALIVVDYTGPFDTYDLTIDDIFSDGICCSYGLGYYQIKVDGEIVLGGPGNGAFGSTVTESFSTSAKEFPCLNADPSEDSDGDGVLNFKDADFCTLNTAGTCTTMDADSDGIPNYLDLDADNDGIPDIIEASGVDTNGDGQIDYPIADTPTSMLDLDGDGFSDTYDDTDTAEGTSAWVSGTTIPYPDSDNDNIPDALDLDADNDGIPDIVEMGGVDANGDGRVDASYANDVDNDGYADTYDANNNNIAGVDDGGTPIVETNNVGNLLDGISGESLDTDGDSFPDHLDLDSDNDGVPDLIEAGGEDPEGDGMVDTQLAPWDADEDGLADIYDTNASDGPASNGLNGNALVKTSSDIFPDGHIHAAGEKMLAGGGGVNNTDADNDAIPNHLDLDADNDGILDVQETGVAGLDANGDGMIDGAVGNNGYNDALDPLDGGASPIIVSNSDDGTDSDSRYEYSTGGATNAIADSDGDDVPDYLDVDSDNDGIYDNYEAQATANYIAPGTTDSDGDGILNAYDADATASQNGLTPYNHNSGTGDTTPDYLDIDSDGDNIPDQQEAWDDLADGDSLEDNVSNCNNEDSDGDGLVDCFDNNDTSVIDISWAGKPADDNASTDANTSSTGVVFAAGSSLDNLLPDNGGDNINEPDYRDHLNACTTAQVYYGITEAANGVTTEYEYDATTAKHIDGSDTKIIRATTFCEPDADGWYYYFNPLEPANYLFAIRNSAGSPNTVAMWDLVNYIEIKVASITERQVAGETSATLVMGRDWNIEFKNTPTSGSTFDVKFYFDPADMAALDAAADNLVANAADAVRADLVWFKKSGGVNSSDITEEGITNMQDITSYATSVINETSGNQLDGTNASTGNGKNYVEFSGLSSFSGGTAAIQIAYSVLPVELSSFEATANGCAAILYWSTETEENFSHFEIERSPNGRNFKTIDQIDGIGDRTLQLYQYEDKAAEKINYYRLKMVDFDGFIDYSKILVVETNCGIQHQEQMNLYPNPVSKDRGFINVKFYSEKKQADLIVTDILGRTVIKVDELFERGWNTLLLDISILHEGQYFIHNVNQSDETIQSFKFIVIE